VYLQEELQLNEAARQQTRLSLNEAQRKRELEEQQARRLALENARRAAKGLEPLAALEPGEQPGVEEIIAESMPSAEAELPDEPDPLLLAASHIRADALPLYRKPSFASRNY